jgi:hypothetical protein
LSVTNLLELTALAAVSAGVARIAVPLGLAMAFLFLLALGRTVIVLRRQYILLGPPSSADRHLAFIGSVAVMAILTCLWFTVMSGVAVASILLLALTVGPIHDEPAVAMLGLAVGVVAAFWVTFRAFSRTLSRPVRDPKHGVRIDTEGPFSHGVVSRIET